MAEKVTKNEIQIDILNKLLDTIHLTIQRHGPYDTDFLFLALRSIKGGLCG